MLCLSVCMYVPSSIMSRCSIKWINYHRANKQPVGLLCAAKFAFSTNGVLIPRKVKYTSTYNFIENGQKVVSDKPNSDTAGDLE